MRISRRSYLQQLIAETVVVHAGGQSVQGILAGAYADTFVLKHAALLHGSGRVPIDGEALIPRGKVTLIQRLGTPAEGSAP